MKTERSLEERKRSENEMWEWLRAIPVAKGNPFSHYEALIQEMSILERTIKRLKAFIAFLRKLNPAQYLKWMNDAFSRYTPSKQPQSEKAPAPLVPETVALPSVKRPALEQPSLPSPTYKP